MVKSSRKRTNHLGKKVRLKPKRGRNRSGSINSPVTK